MKQNKFVVIVTCYNKAKWVGFNINSLKQQSYGNFIAIYGYDKSKDNTLDVIARNIEDDTRLILVHNKVQESQLTNYFNCIDYLEQANLISDEDIIVELDADDWLLHPFVFQYLNQIYQDPSIWMTYGQYVHYPGGHTGGHFHLELDDEVDRLNNYRQATFPYSHLKTYKYHLLKKVPPESLINPETGKIFDITADFALCMPMVEMAGKKRIYRVEEPIYVYNVSEDANNESQLRLHDQKHQEFLIRTRIKPCSRI